MSERLIPILGNRCVEERNDLHPIDPGLGIPPDSRVLYERFLGGESVRRQP
ncbi:hypothetical protein ACIBF5_25115 [Micromonospora sp. NPDC050417]|uniref:hypothetical protein n=1 Tax=Micromonospora sp. NPDC050417 TaxID=3364280 RepID=UPI0037B9852C